MPKISFASLFPRQNPDALDLLDKLLAFDPSQRITVEESLEHKYLSIWHDASDEPNCPTPFDFGFEVVTDIPQMRQMIIDEVRTFRQAVRAPTQQQQQNRIPDQHIPIPENHPRQPEEPRPQETMANAQNLESDLINGLDGARQ